MKLSFTAAIAFTIAIATPAVSFVPQCNTAAVAKTSAAFSTMADSGVPPTESTSASSVDDGLIPTKLPSDVGFDYVPLAGALAAGDLVQADQVRMNYLLDVVIIILQ